MFFHDRIKNIKDTDRVLEIGPGSDPHPRSDVLLEMKYADEKEYASQFGKDEKLVTGKNVVYYDGGIFPFKDKAFDYVICSHVLEHVPDVPAFLSEMFRVAGKGYLEYPLVYYEYLYNFDVHLNLLKYDGNKLVYLKKDKLPFVPFRPVQDFFLQSIRNGHVAIINELIAFFMEGFEWDKPFSCKEASGLGEVCHKEFTVPMAKQPVSPTTWDLIKQLIKKTTGRR